MNRSLNLFKVRLTDATGVSRRVYICLALPTQLLRKKMPVKAVSQRLGHSDVTTTLRTYAHVFATDDAELAEAVEDFIAAPTAPA